MYDDLSEAYDYFVDWDARLAYEMPFIEEYLREVNAVRVLDTACGTGMHALALARRGYHVVGTDFSVNMIDRARSNASKAGLEVQFAVAEFGRTWAVAGDGFDVVLCLGNSLPHVRTLDDLSETLTDFASCLRPGGRLLVQSRNFDAVLRGRERWMEPQSRQVGSSEWLFVRFYDFRPDGLLGFNIVTLHRPQQDDQWRQRPAMTLLRPWQEHEMRKAFVDAGFTVVTAWGDMQRAPFDTLTSPNLIISGQRRDAD
ncbi:MAG: class I SAM-dependent methyltransferase [Chloroflexi bacterium]|nr:class I SAM-dependent methyltransferase [Chloroflexota bacterium]